MGTLDPPDDGSDVETVNDALLEAFRATKTGDIGCIVYVFDRSEGGGGTGFNSENCDMGDAMVLIKRLSKRFDIDLDRLYGVMEK